MPNSAQRSLVKPFEPSSCAAACDGPNTLMPPPARSSASPATSGASGPTTTKPMSFSRQKLDHAAWSPTSSRHAVGDLGDAGIARRADRAGRSSGLAELPGQRVLAPARADQQDVHGAPLQKLWKSASSGLRHAACSCIHATRRSSEQAGENRGSMAARRHPPDPQRGQRIVAGIFASPSCASALKRTVEDAYRLGAACAARSRASSGLHSSGHCYFTLKDEKAVHRRASSGGAPSAACKFKPAEGARGGGHRPHHHLSRPVLKYQIVIDALEPAGIGALMALLEERKKQLAAEGLFDEARKQRAALSAARRSASSPRRPAR